MSVNNDTDNMFQDNDFSPSFLLATAEIAEKLERQHQSSQSRVETVIEGETISICLSDGEEYYSNDYQEHAASDDKADSSVPKLSQDNSPTTEYRLSPVEASFIEEEGQESYVMVEKESMPEYVSEANQVPEREDQEMKDASIEDDVEMEAAADESVKSKPVTSDNAVVATQEVIKETVSVDITVQREQAPVQEKEKTPEPESMDVIPQPEEKIPKETEKTLAEKEKTLEEKEETPEEKEKTPQPESMNITSQPEEKERTPEEKAITPTPEETKEPAHLEKQVEEQAAKEKDINSQAEQDKEKDNTIEQHIDNEKKEDAIVEKETEQEKEEELVVEQQAERSKQDDTPQKQDISKPTEEALMEMEETATEPREPEEINNDTSPLDEDKENRTPPKVTKEATPEPQDIVMTEQEEEEENESEEGEPKEKSMSPLLEKEDTPIEQVTPETEEVNASEDDDEENDQYQYEVETIRSHKIYRGKVVRYEVKWKDWPEEDNTNELSETIHADVPDICTEYWSNLKLKAVPTNAKQFVNKRSVTPKPVQRTPKPVNKRKATPEASAPTKRARTAIYTVKKHEVTRKLVTAGFVIPSTEEWPNTLDDWESDIASIHSVQPSDKDKAKLLAYLKWNNGKKTIHLLKDIHNKCPKKLIDYYEGVLRFYK